MERDDCFLGELRCFCVRPEGGEAPEVTESGDSQSRGTEGEDGAEGVDNDGAGIDADGPIYVTELPHPSGRILTRALAPKPQAEVAELAQQGELLHNNFVGGDIEVSLCVEQDSPQRNIMTEIVDLQSPCPMAPVEDGVLSNEADREFLTILSMIFAANADQD